MTWCWMKNSWFEFPIMCTVFPPEDTHFLMQEKFQSSMFWHFYSLQLKCFKMFTAKEEPVFAMKVFFLSG